MIIERYELSINRIKEILFENKLDEKYKGYFQMVADFIILMDELKNDIKADKLSEANINYLQTLNKSLYEDILPENYEKSYANPTFAVIELEEYGQILSFLYTEIRGMIPLLYENRLSDVVTLMEVFIEIYNVFEDKEELSLETIKNIIYYFISDYADVTLAYRVREQVDYELDFAYKIITNSDLHSINYLYKYGEYISENEIKMAEYLSTLDDLDIEDIARTYTNGYKLGFERSGKDISIKKSVNIRYPLGFERVVKAAIKQFEEMGLKPVIYRGAVQSINKKQNIVIGYFSTSPNKQFDYDHRFDNALYLDKALNDRKLAILKTSYEEYKKKAALMGGPAVIEVFGEKPFTPKSKKEAPKLNKKQQELSNIYANKAASITNEYIKGEERSFTIIAYPIPEIGDNFEEIFEETKKINNLDQDKYENIQNTIIDSLDKADYVIVTGKEGNKTNIKINLCELNDVDKETRFENCLADVNIPLGEVFTSPKLEGTTGLLYVKEVYINELLYKNLELEFVDGIITNYTCSNFEDEKMNKDYIKENILYNHDTLPMGEFAIGTNTTAYNMAKKYDIMYKLPILIVEKMGPHFAVGDTCFSFEEEQKTYNPNGKEIIAKENTYSKLRNESIDKAYFNCHTDITIPYAELADIVAISKDGSKEYIIKDGKFSLDNTTLLNEALV